MPRVVYVTGWCRSGSTVIGNLLNEHPAAAHVGELSYLWANGVTRTGTNSCCGCGADLARCPVWREVLKSEGSAAAAREMIDGHARFLRTRHTPARLAEAAGRRATPPQVARLVGRMTACYRAVADAAGVPVVIDTSKFPAEAAALCGVPGLDVRVLHLVRDPRATAYSWQRSKSYIPPMPPARSSGYWTAFNAASELIARTFSGRCLRVRYEDFAERPRQVLGAIMTWAGLDGEPPVDEAGEAVLGVNHTVTGNPDRLRRGPVHVHPEDAWRATIGAGAAAAATLLGAPLLPRYGYRLTGWRTGHGPRA